jgi:phosphatidylserine/phosphatidylglycerophosphate/cardiolipin synthase-like enzyme
MRKTMFLAFTLILSVSFYGCTTPDKNAATTQTLRTLASGPKDQLGLNDLPQIAQLTSAQKAAQEEAIAKAVEKSVADDKQQFSEDYAAKVATYLNYLGTPETLKSFGPSKLFRGSTQFILCDDFTDWECLEKAPYITPNTPSRVDESSDLGDPIQVNEDFKMKWWFTKDWYQPQDRDPNDFLVEKLAAIIKGTQWDAMYMATYGFDQIHGSMEPVYTALKDRFTKGTDIRAVFDIKEILFPDEKPLIFSHVVPPANKPSIYSPTPDSKLKQKQILQYQYADTLEVQKLLNSKPGTNNENSKARIEWRNDGIMHNKFIVFEKNKKMSLWSGTANLSATCMGSENNSNMGIYIENDAVARAFYGEFEEMYNLRDFEIPPKKPAKPSTKPSTKPKKPSGSLTWIDGGDVLRIGKFHTEKRPNTPRYFKFSDGHEVRVHFSPTDDAEHRVILPMLLSAKKGDIVRIAMFGFGGLELERALQAAAARGVILKVVFDNVTTGAWRKNNYAAFKKNPYTNKPTPNFQFHIETWPKWNHMKIGTLTRKVGSSERAEIIVVGSQNWSGSGNDKNDENVVTVRNLKRDVEAAVAFNEFFDEHILPNSMQIDEFIQKKMDKDNEKSDEDEDDSGDDDDDVGGGTVKK